MKLKFVNNTLDIKNFGSSVAKSKLGAEASNFLLFHTVQDAHHSLIVLENF